MESRERVIRAIKFQRPDRIPIKHRTLMGAFLKYGKDIEELYSRYPGDVLRPGYPHPGREGDKAGEPFTDSWGVTWLRFDDSYHGHQIGNPPISDWKDLETYRFPDSPPDRNFTELKEAMSLDGHRHYFLAEGGTLFHRMTYLRGYENLMVDLAEGRKEILYLQDKITEYILKGINRWAEIGVDGIIFADDWGTQQNLYINPELWRNIFKPAYRKMFDAAHQAGALVHFHTDGVTREIIPDLIEIGADALNLQLNVMKINDLGKSFGQKVCFHGGYDRQKTLPFGTEEEVRQFALLMIDAFANPEGGLIGGGQIGPDVPLRNAATMLKTFYDYRW